MRIREINAVNYSLGVFVSHQEYVRFNDVRFFVDGKFALAMHWRSFEGASKRDFYNSLRSAVRRHINEDKNHAQQCN